MRRILEALKKDSLDDAENIVKRALKAAPPLKKAKESVAQDLRTFTQDSEPTFPAFPWFDQLWEVATDSERNLLRVLAQNLQAEMDEEDDAEVMMLAVDA